MANRTLKQKRQNLSRRRETVINKCYELGQEDGVDVAVIIRMNSRYYTYRSIDDKSWPPHMEHIVSCITSCLVFCTIPTLR